MSQPTTRAPAPHRFTRMEYYRMGDAGLFADERVELLDGTIVTMAPNSPPNAARRVPPMAAPERALLRKTMPELGG